ncbi:MAG: hypothetical protein LBR07_03710 [Puniceicoccales bacterium]|jgi:hypothetical protein|nr:hypothetical protein [Puniceicoccales bacterium]
MKAPLAIALLCAAAALPATAQDAGSPTPPAQSPKPAGSAAASTTGGAATAANASASAQTPAPQPEAVDSAPDATAVAEAANAAADTANAAAAPATPASPAVEKIRRENLVSNNPFRSGVIGRGGSAQTYEIRGFAGRGADLEVSITNPATRECHWVKVRDPEAKWFVESADPVARTAVIKINDVSLDIEMAKPSEMPTPIRPAGGAGFAVPPRAPNIISMPSAGAQTRAQTTPAVTPANSRAGGATGGASRSGGTGTRGSGSGRSSSGSRR